MESYFPWQKREPCFLCESSGLIEIEDEGDFKYSQGIMDCPLCMGKGELYIYQN
jgi:hypothetical protein